jgi:hypothetical protein
MPPAPALLGSSPRRALPAAASCTRRHRAVRRSSPGEQGCVVGCRSAVATTRGCELYEKTRHSNPMLWVGG